MVPDNIKVGDTVAVIKCLSPDAGAGDFAGLPHIVIAVSLPFVALRCMGCGVVQTLDARFWELGKVSKRYARVVSDDMPCNHHQHGCPDAPQEAAEPDPRRCVRCGERMVQRNTGPGQWRWWCEQCRSLGDLVEAK